VVRERRIAYEKAHPEVKRAAKHRRRALGKIDPKFVKFIYAQPCLDCGTTERRRTLGHLIPVVRGGTNHPLNLVAQCRSCNSKQHSRVHPRAMMVHYPEAVRYAAAA
jgi:5-methylcytosine-specific restriction endonuclease McrA